MFISEVQLPQYQRTICNMKDNFSASIEKKIGNYTNAVIKNSDLESDDIYNDLFVPAPYDIINVTQEPQDLNNDGEPFIRPNMDDYHDEPYSELNDKFIGQKLQLPLREEMCGATVLRRKRRSDGTLVGTSNKIPMIDTRIYEVQYADGTLAGYHTNNLLENVYE